MRNPFQTEPDLAAVRHAYSQLELFIAQDIFMTKSVAEADVVFPATSWGEHEGVYSAADRGFQRFYKAVEPKGDVKPDWEIHSLMATAMGYPMKYRIIRRKSGMKCGNYVHCILARPMTRWPGWVMFHGLV